MFFRDTGLFGVSEVGWWFVVVGMVYSVGDGGSFERLLGGSYFRIRVLVGWFGGVFKEVGVCCRLDVVGKRDNFAIGYFDKFYL